MGEEKAKGYGKAKYTLKRGDQTSIDHEGDGTNQERKIKRKTPGEKKKKTKKRELTAED